MNAFRFALPCGHFDSVHHKDLQHAAECELSEEARLKAEKIVRLLPDDHEGIMEVKWCLNKFIPFLALNPIADPTPLPRDKEEQIEVHRNVSVSQLKEHMLNGAMMLHSVQTSFIALHFLEQHGLL